MNRAAPEDISDRARPTGTFDMTPEEFLAEVTPILRQREYDARKPDRFKQAEYESKRAIAREAEKERARAYALAIGTNLLAWGSVAYHLIDYFSNR